jgi:hypothetical protein
VQEIDAAAAKRAVTAQIQDQEAWFSAIGSIAASPAFLVCYATAVWSTVQTLALLTPQAMALILA